MSLAHGRQHLAIPGPSVIPDEVLRAMHRPSPNIYEGELIELTESLLPDLRRVARTGGDVAIYIGNGHAGWEAALANVIAPGESVLVPATGPFGPGWGEMAEALGARAEVIDFGKRAPVDPARVAEVLAADSAHRIKAVLLVHVDTGTSVRNDVAAVRRAIDAAGHPALLMVDCIASLACDRFEMDAWGVDVMVSACQKGLMTPPGLAFVFFNSRAARARAALSRVSRYWDWRPRVDPEFYYQLFCGTAPTLHLYGLRAALDMIAAEGLEAVWARHARLAGAIWAAVEAWGQGGPMELNIAEPAHRSHAVTTLRLGEDRATRIRRWTEANAGVTLGIGLGMAAPTDPAWHGFFRIGHMGHVSAAMILGALGAIEAAMRAERISFGQGALEAAAAVCAGD